MGGNIITTKKILRTLAILVILASNISCDQISKSIIRQSIGDNERIDLLHNYLTIMKVENTGAFLSLGHSFPPFINRIFLIVLPLILLGSALIYLLTKSNLSILRVLGICLIVGGGIGNIYDRLVYGSVTDFLHIDFVFFHTGIFNMADVSVMTGIFIILVEIYTKRIKLDYKISENQDNL